MKLSTRDTVMILVFPLFALCAIPSFAEHMPPSLAASTPRPETIRAFDGYVNKTDATNAKSLSTGNFLWIDDLDQSAKAAAYTKLKRGEVVMQRITPFGEFAEIPGGMIHDWEGM